jgi:MFS family permease
VGINTFFPSPFLLRAGMLIASSFGHLKLNHTSTMRDKAYEQVTNNDNGKGPVSAASGSIADDSLPAHQHQEAQIEAITVDDAIERMGMGRFQLKILTAAGLCFASDAMQVMLLSFLSEVLKVEWNLTDDETAFITSNLFVGAIFGTLMLGPLADKKGRKPVFMCAAMIISIFGVAVAFATNYWTLLALLFIVGFGVGGLTVPFDILSEVLPAASRGKNLLFIEYFWTVGVLLVVAAARFTLGVSGGGGNWRLFVMLCSLPCFTSIFLGYLWVPESPRWLCTQEGRSQEALDIVRMAAKMNRLDADFLFPEGMEIVPEEEEESDCFELFSPRWRWTTLKLWGAWGAFAFGYYGTIMVVTEIFDEENDSGQNTYDFDYGAIFVSSSAELIGTTFAISTVDTLGRIPLQVVSYTLAGISVCVLCILADRDTHRDTLIAFSFAARIFEMCGSCVTWVSTAEVLTTEVRTTGHSAANAVARIGSIIAPFLIVGHSSLTQKGLVMLAIHAITVICVSQLPETKGSHMGRISTGEIEEERSQDDDEVADIQSDDGLVLT